MPQSVYKVIELIGTSTKSWQEAAQGGCRARG
jgi:flavin-binding protein dodecin